MSIRSILLSAAILIPSIAFAQTNYSPTYNGVTANTGTFGSASVSGGVTAGSITLSGSGSTGDVSGTSVTAMGGSAARTQAVRAADVINVADYGAKCDGSTNDNTAINTALAAGAASSAYTNNRAIRFAWPNGAQQSGCVINSLNLTIFNRGNGANPNPRVELGSASFLCQGAGNICFDATDARYIDAHDITIRGDNVSTPKICLQVGVKDGVSAAWHDFSRFNCGGYYTFTAFYNVGSEANTYTSAYFTNAYTTAGPIQSLGTITGGSGGADGTYNAVALTGGSGSGATANITVSGGAVTAVVLTYEGQIYRTGDVLSASSASIGGVTGFSVPVTMAQPYSGVIDGANHWRASSAFVPITIPVDTFSSLTLNTFVGGSFRGGAGLWTSGAGGLRFVNNYVLSSGVACITLHDSGISKWGHNFETNCEGTAQSTFRFSGTNSSPIYTDFRWRGYSQVPGGTFLTDSHINSVTMNGVDLDAQSITTVAPMFDAARKYSLSGQVTVHSAPIWNAPQAFQGRLTIGGNTTPPGLGPCDILSGAVGCWSAARQIVRGYTGPLIRIQRASDSAQTEIYANAFGDLDRAVAGSFCYATTCSVSALFDQTGNNNHFTQTTAASQPTLNLSSASLGGRQTMTWATAAAMQANASATLNDLWATGGYLSTVVIQSSNALPNRLLAKISGSGASNPGVGWDIRANPSGANPFTFTIGATTSNGVWTTSSALSNAAHVYDFQYSAASLSNNPTVEVDGTSVSVAATAPVGTISSDSSQVLFLGNNQLTAGTRGFIGSISELVMWKTTPTATQLEAIRRNQAAYYGVAGVY
jgi:hypothetical protein